MRAVVFDCACGEVISKGFTTGQKMLGACGTGAGRRWRRGILSSSSRRSGR